MASAYSLHSEVMGLNPDKGFLTRYSRTAHLIKILCNVVLVYLLDPDFAYLSLLSPQAAQLRFFFIAIQVYCRHSTIMLSVPTTL